MSDFDHRELEELSEQELSDRYERGDFVAIDDLRFVRARLNKYAKEREFFEACEKASRSAALVAQRWSLIANIIAVLALTLSLVSLIWQIASSAA